VEQLGWAYHYTCRLDAMERLGRQVLEDLPSKMDGVVAQALGQLARNNAMVGDWHTARALVELLDERAADVGLEDPAEAAIRSSPRETCISHSLTKP
jgi:hypothetical protein